MIHLIFTLDYEIFGNGEGSLEELVYEPTNNLIELFNKFNCKFVNFVEAAEFEKIKKFQTDRFIQNVEEQIRELYQAGYEIGLHIHPQWFDAIFNIDKWNLNFNEYNLCNISKEKREKYFSQSIEYLKAILGREYNPVSFRAGGWLIQPTEKIYDVLVSNGIKIDSSMFKGGLYHYYGLDFRKSQRNGFFWKFSKDVNTEDKFGKVYEIPCYTKMVYPWKMISKQRLAINRVSSTHRVNKVEKFYNFYDRLRFKYPQKFDFTKMYFRELKAMIDELIVEDNITPTILKPIVLIGHPKNLPNINEIDKFLSYVQMKKLKVSTFNDLMSFL